jgi:hypothetical protein
VVGDTVTFLTLEADQGGKDLDDDGDNGGLVLQTFNARAAAEASGAGGEADVRGGPRLVAAGAIGAVSVQALAGTSAGICTDTAEACASADDCAAGSCFVPPGGCIEDLGIACTCGQSGCSGCGGGEFCVPTGDGAGVCHIDRGPCASDADCTAPAMCEDAAEDIVRLFGPLAEARSDGRQVFLSAGLRTEATGSACLTDADCAPGEVCTEAGTCQEERSELISVGAPDTDGDGVVDPFDNCPQRPNPDQADLDGDAVGDLCDRSGPDADSDGWPDPIDNCTEAANPNQLDTDGDNYGNACDCDFDQSGTCNIADFSIFRVDFRDTYDSGVGTDMDGSGRVGIGDFSLFREGFRATVPGPSGLVP